MQRDVVAREAGTHTKWALCAPNRSCKRTPAPTGAPWAGNTLLNGQVAVTEVCREATHVRPRTDTLRTLRQRPPSQPYSPSATSGQPRWPTGAALASRSLCLSVLFSPRYLTAHMEGGAPGRDGGGGRTSLPGLTGHPGASVPGSRGKAQPQKLSTKLPGKSPVRPVLCRVPLYQPSSRFLCTKTMSPSFSSISASLWGG